MQNSCLYHKQFIWNTAGTELTFDPLLDKAGKVLGIRTPVSECCAVPLERLDSL